MRNDIKACSFLPAVTQMIYDMNLEDKLYGVTFECPQKALSEKQRVIRYKLENNNYTSSEIEQIFSTSKQNGESLHYVDESVLEDISPDVIFTQDVCEICQIDTASSMKAVSRLKPPPKVVSVSPDSLEDVFLSAVNIAGALGEEKAAFNHLSVLKKRIDEIIDTQRKYRLMPKRVSLLEWIEPIYNCGHWIPHQIACAGGVDMLSVPSGNSIKMSWEKIVKYDPEVLVIAPCGFKLDRSVREFYFLTQKEGWQDIKAVKNDHVYFVDFDLFTQPSASTLTDGIEVLARLFHPEYFELSPELISKQLNIRQINQYSTVPAP